MSDKFIPDTEYVADHYASDLADAHGFDKSKAEFQRWLENHDANLRRSMLDELRDLNEASGERHARYFEAMWFPKSPDELTFWPDKRFLIDGKVYRATSISRSFDQITLTVERA